MTASKVGLETPALLSAVRLQRAAELDEIATG